jgi:phosphoesterase RecJ-like protein
LSVPREILDCLTGAKNVLFTSHVPPDGDGLGAGIALVRWLRSRGAKAIFAAGGPVQSCLRFLYREDEIDFTPSGPAGEYDVAISLDAATHQRLAGVAPLFDAVPVTVNVDHHGTNERFGSLNWVDPDASSTGEMIYRVLTELDVPLTDDIARPLYVAVLTDTGRFSFSNTTPAVHEMAATLLATGVRPDEATGAIYRSVPPSFLRLTGLAIENLAIRAGGRIASVTASKEMIERAGADPLDVGDLVDIPISIEGVEVGVLFRPSGDGGTKISLRSREWFSVSEFAGRFGGGGHPRAAGAKLDAPVDEARETVLSALTEAIEAARSPSG